MGFFRTVFSKYRQRREETNYSTLSAGCFFGGVMKKVAVIMGSDSDLPVMKKAMQVLQEYGVPFEAHVYSAHRTPVQAADFAQNARANGFGAIIAGAGMAAALAGVLAGHTTLPVIGVPLKSAVLEGTDALLSTVMMPSGIPVATVAIDGAKNAAYLAMEILAVSDDELAERLLKDRRAMQEGVLEKDAKLQDTVKEMQGK
jgi:5-(carboxyamino)imidazole ribonucleotide mutase